MNFLSGGYIFISSRLPPSQSTPSSSSYSFFSLLFLFASSTEIRNFHHTITSAHFNNLFIYYFFYESTQNWYKVNNNLHH